MGRQEPSMFEEIVIDDSDAEEDTEDTEVLVKKQPRGKTFVDDDDDEDETFGMRGEDVEESQYNSNH